MQQRMTVAGPWSGADGLCRSSKSCGNVSYGPKRGGYVMSWLGAAPERDLTSNFADDAGLHCNGGGWGGCVGVAHRAGTCEEGRCRIGVDPLSQGFYDVADEVLKPHGKSTCRTGWCYFSLNEQRHVWVRRGHFAAGAWVCGSCWGNAKSQSTDSHKSRDQSPGTRETSWHSNDWALSAAQAALSDIGFLLQNRTDDSDFFEDPPSTAVHFQQPGWDVKNFAGLLCTLCSSLEDESRPYEQDQTEDVWVIIWHFFLLYQQKSGLSLSIHQPKTGRTGWPALDGRTCIWCRKCTFCLRKTKMDKHTHKHKL